MPPRIAKKPAVPEPVDEAEKLKTQLRDALLEANESGKMNQVLEAHLDSMDVEEVWMGGIWWHKDIHKWFIYIQ